MTIVVVGKFYIEGFASHIAETLAETGNHVICFDPGLKRSNGKNIVAYRLHQIKSQFFAFYQHSLYYRESVEKRIRKIVTDNKVDLVISCHDFLTKSMVSAFKSNANTPVVLWFPDHVGVFGKSMFLNAGYDHLFFKDPYIVCNLSNELGLSAYYLPECCNPNYHKKVELSVSDRLKYACDITTAGNMHPNRLAVFSNLTNYDCKIWGNPEAKWMDITPIKKMMQYEFVANEEKSKAFSAAKIVVNNLQSGEIIGVNVRTFEIAACGGFQIMNHREGLSELYSDDEIVTYETIGDLKEKIEFYLERPEERASISARAYERTHREHTYTHRLTNLINTVFGSEKGFPSKYTQTLTFEYAQSS